MVNFTLDETNLAIIRELRDGRKSFSSIADMLDITENTVRARVNKLIEDGILDIIGTVDPQKLDNIQLIILGVNLKTLDLSAKAAEFCKLKGVISAVVVTGRYDLIVQVMLNDKEGYSLLDFFTHELDKISDIRDAETFVVYEAHNSRIPYVL